MSITRGSGFPPGEAYLRGIALAALTQVRLAITTTAAAEPAILSSRCQGAESATGVLSSSAEQLCSRPASAAGVLTEPLRAEGAPGGARLAVGQQRQSKLL